MKKRKHSLAGPAAALSLANPWAQNIWEEQEALKGWGKRVGRFLAISFCEELSEMKSPSSCKRCWLELPKTFPCLPRRHPPPHPLPPLPFLPNVGTQPRLPSLNPKNIPGLLLSPFTRDLVLLLISNL